MKKILIATHGYLADGFKSSLEILAGSENYIVTINAYTDSCIGDYEDQIFDFINSVGEEDEAVIFTDLMSGSVNQKVCRVCMNEKSNIPIITDSNLMCILAIILESRTITTEVLSEIVEMIGVSVVSFELPEVDDSDFLLEEE